MTRKRAVFVTAAGVSTAYLFLGYPLLVTNYLAECSGDDCPPGATTIGVGAFVALLVVLAALAAAAILYIRAWTRAARRRRSRTGVGSADDC